MVCNVIKLICNYNLICKFIIRMTLTLELSDFWYIRVRVFKGSYFNLIITQHEKN